MYESDSDEEVFLKRPLPLHTDAATLASTPPCTPQPFQSEAIGPTSPRTYLAEDLPTARTEQEEEASFQCDTIGVITHPDPSNPSTPEVEEHQNLLFQEALAMERQWEEDRREEQGRRLAFDHRLEQGRRELEQKLNYHFADSDPRPTPVEKAAPLCSPSTPAPRPAPAPFSSLQATPAPAPTPIPAREMERRTHAPLVGLRQPRALMIKPPLFEGTGTIEAFLAQFGVAAQGNQWTEQEKGLHLATSLRGATSEVLAHVDATAPDGFQKLEAELRARYQSTPRACQHQLTSRRLEKGETLQQLGDDVLRLTRRAFPDLPFSAQQQMAGSNFLTALHDEETRRFVILSRPQTYQEYISAAIEAQPLNKVKITTTHAVLAVNGGQNRRPERELLCWLCRGPHLQRNCPEYVALRKRLSGEQPQAEN